MRIVKPMKKILLYVLKAPLNMLAVIIQKRLRIVNSSNTGIYCKNTI